MSTLTELIAEAIADTEKPCRKALAANPGKGCTVMGYDHCLCLASARAAAAVVADWLESDDTIRAAEDAHPERGGSCCFNMGQPGHRCPPYVTSASMSAALAAEARKGADQ